MEVAKYIVQFVTIVTTMAIIGLPSAIIAKRKGKSFMQWWAFGAVLWPIALYKAFHMDPKGIGSAALTDKVRQVSNEVGALQQPRNIYFADGEVMVDIANKEICIRGRWYRANQIKHWESLAGGHTPYMNIFLDDPAMPIYEYKTMWIPTQQKLVRGLRILDL